METLNKINLKTKIELLGNEANASLSLNPAFRWIKFVLTDNIPNLNGDTIPMEEFSNLIRTGINAPIKMAENAINPGHERAVPLGVITHLTQEENKVVGLAALWEAEREDDIGMIKEMFANNEDLNFSWEIYYRTEEIISEGIRNLKGCILKAATIVGIPAYDGRTKVLAFASQENKMTLEEALAKIAELEGVISEKDVALASKDELIAEKETAIAEKESTIASLNENVTNLTSEKELLASFKESVEAESAKVAKVNAITSKFTEAGIDENYVKENIEKYLSLSEDQIDFIVAQLVHFQSEATLVSNASTKIPNLNSEKTKLTPKELAQALSKK